MSDIVEDFLNTVDLEGQTVKEFEKTEKLLKVFFLISIILSYIGMFLFLPLISPPAENTTGYELKYYQITTEIYNFGALYVFAAIIFMLLLATLLTYRHRSNIECSNSDVAQYKLAEVIREYKSEDRDDDEFLLKVEEFESYMVQRPMFPPLPSVTRHALYSPTHMALQSYVELLSDSDNIESVIEQNADIILEELVKIIDIRYNNKLVDFVEQIDSEEKENKTTYVAILSDIFSNIFVNRRQLTVVSVIMSGVVGVGIFTYVNKDLGMLVTVGLLSGIQIIRSE